MLRLNLLEVMQMESKLKLDDLSGDQQMLAEIIGIDKYLEVTKVFGGLTIYICKPGSAYKLTRNELIRKEFDGWNFRELALKYDLSERTIREIVAPITRHKRDIPPEEQLSFDDIL